MGTAKRERQKAQRKAKQAAYDAYDRRDRNRQRLLLYGGVFFLLVAAGLIGFVVFGGEKADTPTSQDPTADDGSTDDGTSTPVAITVPPPGDSITGDTPCPAEDGSSERITTFENPPPMCIDPAASHRAEVVTDAGTFVIDLDTAAAPVTVNNFVVLARYHYYDGVAFHRIIPGFMTQIGDAVGPEPGFGGPGYTIEDELPSGAPAYELGSVAMANVSEPDSGGSQFFIVTGQQGIDLPPEYSLFGSVTEGFDVVLDIEALGTASGGPTEVVAIRSVTVTEQ